MDTQDPSERGALYTELLRIGAEMNDLVLHAAHLHEQASHLREAMRALETQIYGEARTRSDTTPLK